MGTITYESLDLGATFHHRQKLSWINEGRCCHNIFCNEI